MSAKAKELQMNLFCLSSNKHAAVAVGIVLIVLMLFSGGAWAGVVGI